MALSRRERTGRTIEELIDELDNHLNREEYGWSTEIAFDIAQIGFKNQDSKTSRKFIDEVAQPIAQYHHKEINDESRTNIINDAREELEINFNTDYWRKELEHVEGENHGNHISPKSNSITELRSNLKENFDRNIDVVSGIATGGVAPAAVIDDLFDSNIIDYPRFSPYRQEDTEVHSDEYSDFSRMDILIVDDIIESGQTLRNVAEYYLDRGADNVYFAAVMTNKWDLFESGEVYTIK